jgi:hypothetical protein
MNFFGGKNGILDLEKCFFFQSVSQKLFLQTSKNSPTQKSQL